MTQHVSPVAVAILVMGAIALAIAMPRAVSADSHVPDELVAAMDQWIADQGEESAGPCAETDIDTDIGLWCWEVESATETRAVVGFGPTFSEFTDRVTFELVDGMWTVTDEEGIPPVGDPPPTGSGLAASSGPGMTAMLLAAGAALMLAGAAGFAAARNRD
jgi:hypothetical protein